MIINTPEARQFETTYITEELTRLSVVRNRRQSLSVERALACELDKVTLDNPSLYVTFMSELITTVNVLDKKNNTLLEENRRMKDLISSVIEMQKELSQDSYPNKLSHFEHRFLRNDCGRGETV
ncbi:DNA mismatch repair protein MutS [Acrasis kona]|uniref:DNA mismatch repair protein MutS n=1 Tax=Acrasis kona TaxID=1008807 RepID=A0AAW2ZPX5_9EUKA